MYKSLESNNGKFAKGNKHSPLSPVILGPVPRIFWQQGSNLANKLALLLHKCWGRGFNVFSASTFSVILRRYSLLEVPWRRIHNVIAKAMSICVAFGNKVMDTRLPQPAGCGDKYDVSGFGYRLLRRYTPRNDGASNGDGMHRPWCYKILGTRPRMTGGRGANSFGRSMIEMLGVLAIIGVLSVGGIAGYSKAMEQFKINKIIQDYNMLIFGLMEHQQSFQESIAGEPNLTDTVIALNLVPNNWVKLNDAYLQDTYGNYVNIRYRQKNVGPHEDVSRGVIIDFNLGGVNTDDSGHASSDNFNEKVCFEVFRNVVQPLHSSLKRAGLMGTGAGWSYLGDKFCNDEQVCLHNVSVSEMKNLCSVCDRKERCNLTIIF